MFIDVLSRLVCKMEGAYSVRDVVCADPLADILLFGR